MTRNEIQATVLSLQNGDDVILNYNHPLRGIETRNGLVDKTHRDIVGVTLLTSEGYRRFAGRRVQDIVIV